MSKISFFLLSVFLVLKKIILGVFTSIASTAVPKITASIEKFLVLEDRLLVLFAVRIMPGLLPRSLHSLDLSRNKIVVIEGLRELARLRVLNLSHNRISRIGHG